MVFFTEESLPAHLNRLEKQEAVAVLNEIITTCMLPRYISLERSNPESKSAADNYLLRIKNHFDAKSWNCVKEIIKKYNLSMKEIGDYVIIYKGST